MATLEDNPAALNTYIESSPYASNREREEIKKQVIKTADPFKIKMWNRLNPTNQIN